MRISLTALTLAVGVCIPAGLVAQPADDPARSPDSSTDDPPATESPTPSAAPKDSPVAPTLAQPPAPLEPPNATVPPDAPFPEGSEEVAVVLQFLVRADGGVENVQVVAPAGEPFDAAATEAAARMRFEPARLTTGEAVPVTLTFRMRFSRPAPVEVKDAPPPPPPPVRMGVRLLERGVRKPMADVTVQAIAKMDGEASVVAEAATDERGYARLDVPASTFTLAARAAGFAALEAPVEAQPGEEREEIFYLEPTGGRYRTVVRGRRVRREVVRQVLPRDLIERAPGTSGDTLKVVQSLPGVARSSFDGGRLVLRGANPDDSRVYVEGLQIPSAYHFGGLRSTVRSTFLDELNFVPGNFSAEYGRATGGIVGLGIRDPADDMLRGDFDINLYDAAFSLEGPLSDNAAIGGGFRRSYVDTILPAVLPDDAPLSFDTAPRFYDYQLIATWKPSKTHKLRAFYYGSLDKLELLFDSPRDDPKARGTLATRTMFHALHAQSTLDITPSLRQETALRVGLQQLKFSLGPEYVFDLFSWGFDTRASWRWKLGEGLSLRAGLDAVVRQVDLNLSLPRPPKEGEEQVPASTLKTLSAVFKEWVLEPATYVDLRWRPTPSLTLTPGLRVDYYSPIDRFTVDPRLTAQWKMAERTELRAGVGLYQQQPLYDESSEVFGSPTLLPERSLQTSAGVAHTLAEGVELEVTGFYKKIDQLVVRNLEAGADPEADPYTNEGVGRIHGVESLLKARLEGVFFGWISYTYQRSFRRDRPGDAERPFDFDQPHILTALGSYEIGAGWTAGARFRLVSGNPSTPVLGAVYDTGASVFVPRYGEPNSTRLEAFHQLDVRIDKTWTRETWKLSAYLDVQNVYNRGNPEGTNYNYDFTEGQPITGLPILTILGVKGQW